jgi:hypothetical protein
MTRLKRQDIFLTLVFTMIFVFAFSVSGYSSEDPLNRPPVADAGPDQTVESTSPSGADITLDGSSSFDLDGDALTYLWTWNASSATGVNPTIFLLLGTTTVTLQVDDGNGGTAIDTVTVKVVLRAKVYYLLLFLGQQILMSPRLILRQCHSQVFRRYRISMKWKM